MQVSKTVQCDDKLELFAMKNDYRKQRQQKLSLRDGYKAVMQYARDEDGNPIIYRYADRREDKKFIGVQRYSELPASEQSFFVPCFERELKTNWDNVIIRERDNRLILRMLSLSKTFAMLYANRYSTVLDVLCGLSDRIMIPSYSISKHRADRVERERVRQVLKRRFSIAVYEYNIFILDSALAGAVMCEAVKYCQDTNRQYYDSAGEGTAYIRKATDTGAGIVVYNAGLKHYSKNRELEKLVKIEVQLKGKFLKKNGIDITKLTTQVESIQAVRGVAMAQLNKIAKTQPYLFQAVQQARQENEVLSRLMNVEQRQDDFGQRQDDFEQRLSELERKASAKK